MNEFWIYFYTFLYILSIWCFVSAISHICHFAARAVQQRVRVKKHELIMTEFHTRFLIGTSQWMHTKDVISKELWLCHTQCYQDIYSKIHTHTHTKWHMSQSMPMLFFPGTSLAICFRICSLQIFNIDYVTSIKKNGPSLPFFTSNHFKTEFHTHTTKQQITPIPAEQQEQQRNIYFCTNFE